MRERAGIEAGHPLSTGLRLLPFFATPMVISPIAGALSDKTGRRPVMVTGLALRRFYLGRPHGLADDELGRAHARAARLGHRHLDGASHRPDCRAQRGRPARDGQGIRDQLHGQRLGAVFAIAISTAVFAANGHLGTPGSVTDGFRPALAACAGLALLALLSATAINSRTEQPLPEPGAREPAIAD